MKAKDTQKKKLYSAVVLANQKKIEVYRHNSGSFIDYSDCNTEYKADQLEIIKEIEHN